VGWGIPPVAQCEAMEGKYREGMNASFRNTQTFGARLVDGRSTKTRVFLGTRQRCMTARPSRHFPALVLLATVAHTQSAPVPQAPTVAKQHILFVGNSYTYFNNLPSVLVQFANASQPDSLDAGMVVEGGATLKSLWEHGEALRTIQQGGWTYVVLQEQSTLGPGHTENGIPQINAPTTFYDYSRRFGAEIRKIGAKTVFYLTWSRQDSPQDQGKLTAAYTSIAQELGGILVPVGPAWEAVAQDKREIALHQVDKSHPTQAGTYLAACVFYGALFQRNPAGLPARLVGKPVDMEGRLFEAESHGVLSSPSRAELIKLRPDEARFLQAVAWKVTLQGTLRRTSRSNRLEHPASYHVQEAALGPANTSAARSVKLESGASSTVSLPF
jgi:hypothetical protein